MQKILILCTGNSCRSQMAAGFMTTFDHQLEVHSAGTDPSSQIHPKAVQVMAELGIDISQGQPKSVDRFIKESFDFVITVCASARETCPLFPGEIRETLHIGFSDPAEAEGAEDEILTEFRRVRDEIKQRFRQFYDDKVKSFK